MDLVSTEAAVLQNHNISVIIRLELLCVNVTVISLNSLFCSDGCSERGRKIGANPDVDGVDAE